MKKGEKRLIAILIAITIIVTIVGIVIIRKKQNSEPVVESIPTEQSQPTEEAGEFVEVLEDGTKLNTSNKLHETKTIDGMEISNFTLTTKNNVSLLLGTVKNVSSEVKGGYPLNVTVYDKEGNKIVTVGAYIKELKPEEETEFNASATFDYANAYDFTITRKK